jgi:hypothetical protein
MVRYNNVWEVLKVVVPSRGAPDALAAIEAGEYAQITGRALALLIHVFDGPVDYTEDDAEEPDWDSVYAKLGPVVKEYESDTVESNTGREYTTLTLYENGVCVGVGGSPMSGAYSLFFVKP